MSTSALIVTGAAARISQETALIENLIYDNKNFKLENTSFISGASSGALNTVLFNAVIHAGEEKGKEILQWFKQDVLFPLKTSDVFKFATIKLPDNGISIQLAPLDTSPLRKTLEDKIEGHLNYKKIGDLPINTSLSAALPGILPSLQMIPKTIRFTNTKDKFKSTYLTDVLMASTAIPIIFPMQKVRKYNLISTLFSEYIDGGTLKDRVPYMGFVDWVNEDKENRKVDNLYIVTRQRPEKSTQNIVNSLKSELTELHRNNNSNTDQTNESLKTITENQDFWDKLVSFLKPYSFKTRLEKLRDKYSYVADKIYIYQPVLDKNYPLIRFDQQEAQYNATKLWCGKNDPILLDDFLNKLDTDDLA